MPGCHTPLVCKGSILHDSFWEIHCQPALDSISQVRRESEWEVCLICCFTAAQLCTQDMILALFIPTSSPVLLENCCILELDCMERLSILQVCSTICKTWLKGLKGLFYPSPEFIGHLYLFLQIMSEIIKSEIWYSCAAKKMHDQKGTLCSATLQSPLRRITGSESCCLKPIFSHGLPIRAQKSPLAIHGRWSTIEN